MDAVEFLKTLERQRNVGRDPNDGHCNWAFIYFEHGNHEKLVAEAEQWAKDHPIKTRQSEFLKNYPEARVDESGVLQVCPSPIFAAYRSKDGGCLNPYRKCADCRREYWLQEVE